jgi:hypothetical protein
VIEWGAGDDHVRPTELITGDVDREAVPFQPAMTTGPSTDATFRGLIYGFRPNAKTIQKVAGEKLNRVTATSARVYHALRLPRPLPGCINGTAEIGCRLQDICVGWRHSFTGQSPFSLRYAAERSRTVRQRPEKGGDKSIAWVEPRCLPKRASHGEAPPPDAARFPLFMALWEAVALNRTFPATCGAR